MRFVAPKTFLRISILVVVVLVVLLVGAFVSRTMLEDSNIPSLLEPGDPPTETELIHRDPVVFAMDADGNVYQGRNVIGSLANTSDLTTKMREVIEASASRLAYTAGMDLNLQLPLVLRTFRLFLLDAAWPMHGLLHDRVAFVDNMRRPGDRYIELLRRIDFNL